MCSQRIVEKALSEAKSQEKTQKYKLNPMTEKFPNCSFAITTQGFLFVGTVYEKTPFVEFFSDLKELQSVPEDKLNSQLHMYPAKSGISVITWYRTPNDSKVMMVYNTLLANSISNQVLFSMDGNLPKRVLDLGPELFAHDQQDQVVVVRNKKDGIVKNYLDVGKSARPIAQLEDGRLIITTGIFGEKEAHFQIWKLNGNKPDIDFEWAMTSEPIVISGNRIAVGLKDRILIGTPKGIDFKSEYIFAKEGEKNPVTSLLALPDGNIACARRGALEIYNPNTRELLYSTPLMDELGLILSMQLLQNKILYKAEEGTYLIDIGLAPVQAAQEVASVCQENAIADPQADTAKGESLNASPRTGASNGGASVLPHSTFKSSPSGDLDDWTPISSEDAQGNEPMVDGKVITKPVDELGAGLSVCKV